uniref:Uncharacterized protein n=1 Tax=Plectus sambesii TaxID=2011161 RepID=A0A914VC99_9BILA
MRVLIAILAATAVLMLTSQDVEGLKNIIDCQKEKTIQTPLICIDDPEDNEHAAINTSEIYNRLLTLQTESSVYCDEELKHIKFYLYILDDSVTQTNAKSRSDVDNLVPEENNTCTNYGVLFVSDNSASVKLGQVSATLLDEEKINKELQSVSNGDIEERVFEAIDVLKSALANSTPQKSGVRLWVVLVGVGLIASVLVALGYWVWDRKRDRRGMMPVRTN